MRSKAIFTLAVLVAAGACLLSVSSEATAAPGTLVSCHASSRDSHLGLHRIVTNHRTGCAFAKAFAGDLAHAILYEGKQFHGHVTYVANGQRYPFRLRTKYIPYKGDSADRIQAIGQGTGLFVSFFASD